MGYRQGGHVYCLFRVQKTARLSKAKQADSMDLDFREVKNWERGHGVIPLQAWLAVGEELSIDWLCVTNTGLKLSRLALWRSAMFSENNSRGTSRGVATPEAASLSLPIPKPPCWCREVVYSPMHGLDSSIASSYCY